jgi:hypothetical protein
VKGRGYYTQQVAVLKIPEWVAAHVSELPRPMPCEPITDETRQAIELARAGGVPIVDQEFSGRRNPSERVIGARQELHEQTTGLMYGLRTYRRPLHPDALPPQHHGAHEWTRYLVLDALEAGTAFVYGYDRIDLLALGLSEQQHHQCGRRARATVELQTKCQHPYHEGGPHLCDIDGAVVAVSRKGAVAFIPENMYDPVTIPPAYLVGLAFT